MWEWASVCEGWCTCVFIHNTPRIHSQTNPSRAPATLVCAGSFISSPSQDLFPLCFWTGFKSLIIAAVTSERRPRESGDQLVFCSSSMCLQNLHVCVFNSPVTNWCWCLISVCWSNAVEQTTSLSSVQLLIELTSNIHKPQQKPNSPEAVITLWYPLTSMNNTKEVLF